MNYSFARKNDMKGITAERFDEQEYDEILRQAGGDSAEG